MPRNGVRFVRRGRVVEQSDFAPAETLLDYLRIQERACGTKEGCAEGDCGACTVAVGRLDGNGRVAYEPVNSCILLLGMIDGAEIVTVEDLAPANGRLHPVQRALVDAHASQCGFCTPGFVMSLFTLYHTGRRADRTTVNDWLAGNLCRCTGYRPIADAALACCTGEADDAYAKRAAETASLLAELSDDADLFAGNDDTFFAAPATENALAALCVRYPDATIVGGATDVGLWITKQLRELPRIVHTGRVASLHEVRETSDRIEIGAAATCSEAEGALRGIDPDVGEMLRRLGSKQVRSTGTVGGNIANGSPIGDSPPVLIALGASIELRLRDVCRTLALEDFFLGYGRQDRAPGEILTRITVPRLGQGEHFRCYKISRARHRAAPAAAVFRGCRRQPDRPQPVRGPGLRQCGAALRAVSAQGHHRNRLRRGPRNLGPGARDHGHVGRPARKRRIHPLRGPAHQGVAGHRPLPQAPGRRRRRASRRARER